MHFRRTLETRGSSASLARMRPRAGAGFTAIFAGAFWLSSFAGVARAAPTEYELKAVFLLNFAQFVDWPASAFTDPNQPFCIGVLGDDPFGPVLEQVIAGENVHNHKLTVKRSRRLEELKNCQMLFVCSSERSQVAQVLEEVGKSSILTVSEITGFADRGGMINFFLSDGKVRFEINRGAAERRGLKISSQLLKVARIVE